MIGVLATTGYIELGYEVHFYHAKRKYLGHPFEGILGSRLDIILEERFCYADAEFEGEFAYKDV